MAQKYITLDDAADQLGISKDRLLAMRDSGDAHGYRDGSSWKFKSEEIDRLKASGISEEADSLGILDSDEIDLDTVDDLAGPSDSILLSDVALGESEAGSPSTIIGGSGRDSGSDDSSDLALPSDSGLELDLDLGSESSLSGLSGLSELELDTDDAQEAQGGAGASDVLDIDIDTELGSQFENLEELDVDLESQSSRIASNEGDKGPSGPTDSELSLDSVLGGGSGLGGSEIGLIGEDDDEADVLLGEGSGSDITLSSEDSGISLLGPSDSGLSLDDPDFTLGGSAVGALELGEETPSAGSAGDEEFLLTPDEPVVEDADESGSQVIALDNIEDFDEGAATQLGSSSFGQGEEAAAAPVMAEAAAVEESPMLLEADDMVEEAAPAPVGAPVLAASPDAAGAPVATEARFSALVVTSLAFAVVILGLGTVMMFDLVRNMWSWNEPYVLNSPLMDLLDSLFG